MLSDSRPFGSFSTDSATTALEFYRDVLGLEAEMEDSIAPMVRLHHPQGSTTLIYEKSDHQPATHTVLNFPVSDVEALALSLKEAGVALEPTEFTDADGLARDPEGRMPTMLWFKDPAQNWLSAMQEGPWTP